jgi:hypothetical protein
VGRKEPRGESKDRTVYVSRKEPRGEKRRTKYLEEDVEEETNDEEKSGEDSRVYFNKSYDRHHRKEESFRSSNHSIEHERDRDSRSTRSHRK